MNFIKLSLVFAVAFATSSFARPRTETINFYAPGENDYYSVVVDSFGRVIGGGAEGTYHWDVVGGNLRGSTLSVIYASVAVSDFCGRRLSVKYFIDSNYVRGRTVTNNCGHTTPFTKLFVRE